MFLISGPVLYASRSLQLLVRVCSAPSNEVVVILVISYQIQPEYGDEQADAGRDG